MQGFDSIAAYYDILADNEGRLRREGEFLSQCLREAPGKRVVDLACGTGLHARFFAELGAQVTALDLSAEMIAYAREHRPHPAVTYATGDMRNVQGGPWDLAVCLGNSLSLLGSSEDLAATFRAVRSSLSPGGLFVAQVLNYAAPAAQQPRHRVERKTRDNAEIVAVKSLVPHGDHTLLSVVFHVFRDGHYTAIADTAVLMHVNLDVLQSAANNAGLHVLRVYGGYGHAAYNPESSPDLVLLAQRLSGTAVSRPEKSM